MRAVLYQSALALLTRSKKYSDIRVWGLGIAKRRGFRRAAVAVARKLAVLMHRIYGPAACLQGNSNGMVILVRANLSGLTWELVLRAIMVVRTHLIFLFGRPFWGHRCIQVSGGLGRPLCHPFQITSQTRVGVFCTACDHRVDLVDKREPSGLSSSCRRPSTFPSQSDKSLAHPIADA